MAQNCFGEVEAEGHATLLYIAYRTLHHYASVEPRHALNLSTPGNSKLHKRSNTQSILHSTGDKCGSLAVNESCATPSIHGLWSNCCLLRVY